MPAFTSISAALTQVVQDCRRRPESPDFADSDDAESAPCQARRSSYARASRNCQVRALRGGVVHARRPRHGGVPNAAPALGCQCAVEAGRMRCEEHGRCRAQRETRMRDGPGTSRPVRPRHAPVHRDALDAVLRRCESAHTDEIRIVVAILAAPQRLALVDRTECASVGNPTLRAAASAKTATGILLAFST